MSLLDADLADPLLPYLDATTVVLLSRVNSTFRNWARTHGRYVHLSLQYTENDGVMRTRRTDTFPCHATDTSGTAVRVQYRDVEMWPVMHSTYLMAKPGEPTAIRTERDIPFGSALSRRDSVMAAALVFDDAERSPVPLVETPAHKGGWNKSCDVQYAFTDFVTGDRTRRNRIRCQRLRCINRLSTHFTPRAKFRLRLTLSVALRPEGAAGEHNVEVVDETPLQPIDCSGCPNALMRVPGLASWILPKQMKPNATYTHYRAYSEPFYVVSRVQTAKSIAARKEYRARQRAERANS